MNKTWDKYRNLNSIELEIFNMIKIEEIRGWLFRF